MPSLTAVVDVSWPLPLHKNNEKKMKKKNSEDAFHLAPTEETVPGQILVMLVIVWHCKSKMLDFFFLCL